MNQHTTDSRPHLVPAFFNWLSENHMRVYVTAVVTGTAVDIPPGIKTSWNDVERLTLDSNNAIVSDKIHVETVTLNFGVDACGGLHVSREGISAKVRFNGKAQDVFLPMAAIVSVYAPDGGEAEAIMWPLYFTNAVKPQESAVQPASTPVAKRPTFTVVK